MHLLTLVFGIGLLPSAFTLKCYDCSSSGTCTETQTECPAQGYQCGAQLVAIYAGGKKIAENHKKSCVLTEGCGKSSVNFGVAKTVIITKCCTSDLCNSQPASAPSGFTPNGKMCFSCDDTSCTHTLGCEEDEDYCLSSTVSVGTITKTIKGCTTKQVCSASVQAEGVGNSITCCQGNLCNSATTTGAALLLLVAPLVSLVMIS